MPTERRSVTVPVFTVIAGSIQEVARKARTSGLEVDFTAPEEGTRYRLPHPPSMSVTLRDGSRRSAQVTVELTNPILLTGRSGDEVLTGHIVVTFSFRDCHTGMNYEQALFSTLFQKKVVELFSSFTRSWEGPFEMVLRSREAVEAGRKAQDVTRSNPAWTEFVKEHCPRVRKGKFIQGYVVSFPHRVLPDMTCETLHTFAPGVYCERVGKKSYVLTVDGSEVYIEQD